MSASSVQEEYNPTKVVHIRSIQPGTTNSVYIGRAGKGQEGYFGNPFAVRKVCDWCGLYHATPGATLRCFREYATDRVEKDAEYRKKVGELYGKILICFCAPNPCHGDILRELAKKIHDGEL